MNDPPKPTGNSMKLIFKIEIKSTVLQYTIQEMKLIWEILSPFPHP